MTDRKQAENFLLKVEHDKKAHVFIDPKAGTATFRAEVQETHPGIQISLVSPGVIVSGGTALRSILSPIASKFTSSGRSKI